MATTGTDPILDGSPLSVILENIGGIDQTTHDIPPGVTVLKGENATNRSSFLQGIIGALGGRSVTLNSSADEGKATIEIGDRQYTRSLSRTGNTVQFGGTPYLDDSDAQAAELYAFLTKDNPVRRAVENGDDLTQLLLEPIDKDEIEAEQQRLRDRRDALAEEIDKAGNAADELVALEDERNDVQQQIEELTEEITELESNIEALREEAKGTDSEKEHKELRDKINTKQEEISELEAANKERRSIISDKKEDIASLSTPDVSRDELEDKRTELVANRESLDADKNELRNLQDDLTSAQRVNQLLADNSVSITDLLDAVEINGTIPSGPLTEASSEDEGTELTDQLTESEEILCHACGSHVQRDTIDALQEQYQVMSQQISEKTSTIQSQIDDIDADIDDVDSALSEYENIQTKRATYRDDIDRLNNQIKTAQEDIDELQDEIDELEAKQAELNPDPVNEELGQAQKEKGQKEAERKQKRRRLDQLGEEIQEKEQMAAKEDQLKTERQNVIDELEKVNGKIETIEREIVDQFDDQVQTVLDMLEYNNIARVRFDRKQKETKGRNNDTETTFDMVITREDEAAYEESIENLSESERNVIGLVVALTGYLVHDVHRTCPVMILDSVEMIDSPRLAEIIDYFSQYQEYLIAALLPEDAEAIELDGVNTISW